MSNSNQNKDTQKLAQEVKNLGREIRKLTNAITKATEPLEPVLMEMPGINVPEGVEITAAPGQTMEISMTAQAAVATLKEICKDAEECGRDYCPIFDWCQEHLPDAGAALPPKYWAVPG